jgi:hypothetical protein
MAKQTSFASTLEEAVTTELEYRALSDIRSWKLTKPAFIAAALKQAGADQKRIEQLKTRLDRPGLNAAKQSLRNMIRFIEDRHGGMTCTAPTTRIGWLLGDDSVGELASLGYTGLELFALAAMEADAAAFGPCEDDTAQRATFEHLQARRADLFEALERVWTGGDVLIDTAGLSTTDRDKGHAIVRFRAAPTVTLSPGCGERLVAAILAQRRSDAA